MLQGCGERAFVAAGEADESFGVLFEFLCGDGAFAFFGAQFHFGDQAAEILVAGAGATRKRKAEFTTEALRHGGIQFLIVDVLIVDLFSLCLCVSVVN